MPTILGQPEFSWLSMDI